jgi:hypothetical protein
LILKQVARALDDVADMFIRQVKKMHHKAEEALMQYQMAHADRTDALIAVLREITLAGGPTGYRLMLKRQREGAAMSDPVRLEAGVQMLAEACPGQAARTWDLLRTVLDEGFESIDRRLHELGPLQPDQFSLKEANARLSELTQRWRLWP